MTAAAVAAGGAASAPGTEPAPGPPPPIALAHAARDRNLKIMVGCMLATSLAMAPAMLLTPFADVVDLDGPLLLKQDREPGLRFEGSIINPPAASLWG